MRDEAFGEAAEMDENESRRLVETTEFQTAILVRNLELLQRRRDFYQEVDRAGYLLLRTLERNGPSDIGALSAQLGLDPSTVGRQVNAVRAGGLVEKNPDPSDLRRMVVRATSAGKQAMDAVRNRRLEGTAQLLSGWPIEDLRELAEMFSRYNDAIAQHYLDGAGDRSETVETVI